MRLNNLTIQLRSLVESAEIWMTLKERDESSEKEHMTRINDTIEMLREINKYFYSTAYIENGRIELEATEYL